MTKRTLLPLIGALAIFSATQHPATLLKASAAETRADAACTPKPARTPLVLQSESEPKEETLTGVIVAVRSLSGASVIAVRRSNGIIIEVDIAQDTIIQPDSAHLKAGMHVKVKGETVGCVFTAREITASYF